MLLHGSAFKVITTVIVKLLKEYLSTYTRNWKLSKISVVICHIF